MRWLWLTIDGVGGRFSDAVVRETGLVEGDGFTLFNKRAVAVDAIGAIGVVWTGTPYLERTVFGNERHGNE